MGVELFQALFMGNEFQIVTDHKALCWLRDRKDMSGRLSRWALAIQAHDFDIVYCSGKQNIIADFLSRNPLSLDESLNEEKIEDKTQDTNDGLQLFFIESQQVKNEQRSDQFCQRWRQALSNSGRERYKGFHVVDDVLFKCVRLQGVQKELLVLPNSLFNEIMQEIHDNPHSGGHLGLMKTLAKFRSRYFLPLSISRIEHYVKSCLVCQESKKKHTVLPLQPMIVDNLFDRMEIDIIGPLNRSIHGNQYIISCVECFSRYAICRAIPRATSQAVSDFLVQEVFTRFGMVREILTDRGSVFTSNQVRGILSNYGSRQILATTMHHQTLGLVERLNQTILKMLSKYVDETQRDWCVYLPQVVFAYNCSKQASTKYSPYFVMYSREPRFISDLNLDINLRISDPTVRSQNHRICIDKVKTNLRKARLSQKRYYDKKAFMITFRRGQLVLLLSPKRESGLRKKLRRLYKGLYRIELILPNNNYVIKHVRHRHDRLLIVHANRLKKLIFR